MYQYLSDKQKKQFFGAIVGALGLLTVFLLIQAISGIKQFYYIGHEVNQNNIITVSGTGFVLAVPDTAEFSFSVVTDAKQVASAQSNAAAKTNAIIAALKAMGIADTDIQTTGYNSYPTYSYQNAVCPQPLEVMSGSASGYGSGTASSAIYCPPGKQTLTGYEVSETLSVKVRKTDDAGAALSKVGALGATNISGLSFVVDDINAAQTQARDKAIADAKQKVAHLSKVLGVKLNHIVNFYDGGQTNFYGTEALSMDVKGAGVSAPVVPQIQTGQNKVTANVSISYEVN